MSILVSETDPRGPKAIALVTDNGQWLKCHTRDGRKAYGVPSQRIEGRYYLTTLHSCTCKDFLYRGGPCKHVLAVKLRVELERELRQERAR
jgi:predicted nucleic acid-binding Zn finger protein